MVTRCSVLDKLAEWRGRIITRATVLNAFSTTAKNTIIECMERLGVFEHGKQTLKLSQRWTEMIEKLVSGYPELFAGEKRGMEICDALAILYVLYRHGVRDLSKTFDVRNALTSSKRVLEWLLRHGYLVDAGEKYLIGPRLEQLATDAEDALRLLACIRVGGARSRKVRFAMKMARVKQPVV